MKTIRLLIIMSLLSLFFGCASRPAQPTLLIQPLLDRIVPSDWRGDFEGGERGHYLTIDVLATDLRKNEKGEWTWAGLKYRRTLSLPIFTGASYKQEGWVTLSPKKENP